MEIQQSMSERSNQMSVTDAVSHIWEMGKHICERISPGATSLDSVWGSHMQIAGSQNWLVENYGRRASRAKSCQNAKGGMSAGLTKKKLDGHFL